MMNFLNNMIKAIMGFVDYLHENMPKYDKAFRENYPRLYLYWSIPLIKVIIIKLIFIIVVGAVGISIWYIVIWIKEFIFDGPLIKIIKKVIKFFKKLLKK